MKHTETNLQAAIESQRVWAQIDLDALIHNYQISRDYIHSYNPKTPVIAVIKANAYGHGAAPCARALYGCGCRHFAVASAEEGVFIRHALADMEQGDAEILILGSTAPARAALLHEHRLTQSLYSKEYASALHAEAKRADVMLDVHVNLDTGMHRLGFPAYTPELAAKTVSAIADLMDTCDAFCIKGLFTHLSDADSGNFCLVQWQRFCAVKQALASIDKCPAFCHVCNSPGCMHYPDFYLNGVRIGALLFGVAPMESAMQAPAPGCNLFPVEQIRPTMRLQTRVIHMHTVAAGEPVGYGAQCRADRDRTIATLSVGYADGLLRAYAGTTVTLHTALGDFSVPIVGRICMDLCMIDVTDLPCLIGDVVTLFGNDLRSIAALADHAGTIAYEVPCLITARVPRIYFTSK